MQVQIISDFLCPWCYVGAERLQRALTILKDEAGVDSSVTWKAFLIESRIPDGGMPFEQYMKKRWGSSHPMWLLDVEDAAAGDKIPLKWNSFALCSFTPLAVSEYVGRHYPDKQHEFHLALMRAYYRDDKNISEKDVIGEVAEACGLDKSEIAFQTEVTKDDVYKMYSSIRGVSGVPDVTISFKGKPIMRYSGAQSTQWIVKNLLSRIGTK